MDVEFAWKMIKSSKYMMEMVKFQIQTGFRDETLRLFHGIAAQCAHVPSGAGFLVRVSCHSVSP
jgi:hypothetical protein